MDPRLCDALAGLGTPVMLGVCCPLLAVKLTPLFGQTTEMHEGKRTLGYEIGSEFVGMNEGKWTLGCVMPLLGLAHLQTNSWVMACHRPRHFIDDL